MLAVLGSIGAYLFVGGPSWWIAAWFFGFPVGAVFLMFLAFKLGLIKQSESGGLSSDRGRKATRQETQ